MALKIELPLVTPIYSTYHFQGPSTAMLAANPSIRNWYLNQVMILFCGRRFLSGYTTPEINVIGAAWDENPHFERHGLGMRFLEGSLNQVIRNMLEQGYYVCFAGVDDYYVKGKSWYHERHFNHDGMICGVNQEKKTFSIYAYDQNWIYQRFVTPQRAFRMGCQKMWEQGLYGSIFAVKPSTDQIPFQPNIVVKTIQEYLDSSLEKYPLTGEGNPCGIVVHDYIAIYLDRLIEGTIPYERMDRRVFRLIWEHKKVMQERVMKAEKELGLPNMLSRKYEAIVSEADTMRLLYASHHMKRRDSLLPVIRRKLLNMKELEEKLLSEFVQRAGEVLE